MWKKLYNDKATYGVLLQACVKSGNKKGAEKIVELLTNGEMKAIHTL